MNPMLNGQTVRGSVSAARRGMSLLEVVIAVTILAVVMASYIASMVFTTRVSYKTKADMFANELINRTVEELRASNYDNIGFAMGNEARFLNVQSYESDPQNPNQSVTFNVRCDFLGFGTAAGGGASSLVGSFPPGFPAWETNMWQGHLVMIKQGRGRGQVCAITANTGNTLTVCHNLDGSGGGGWGTSPDATSYFEIDNGKSVRVTCSWLDAGTTRSLTRMSLIPSP